MRNDTLQFKVDNLRNVILEKIAADFVGEVSDFAVDTQYNVETDAIMYRVRRFLMQYSDVKSYVENVTVPWTWVDAFKEKHFPRWLKKIFPVEYKKIATLYTVTVHHMCPHLPVPKEGVGHRHIEKIILKTEELKNM